MALIGSATGIALSPGSQYRIPGVLYAFDDAIVAAWFKPSTLQKYYGRRAQKSPELEELDEHPQSSVTIEEVARRSSAGAWVLPTEEIVSAVLARSKFVGLVYGVSVIKIDSADDVKPFYAFRDATEPVAGLLSRALGNRFENRRSA